MPTWAIIVLILAAVAAVYFLVIKKKGPAGRVAAPAKGPSKKSRWRRALGSATSLAKAVGGSVPGLGSALSVGGQLGIV